MSVVDWVLRVVVMAGVVLASMVLACLALAAVCWVLGWANPDEEWK